VLKRVGGLQSSSKAELIRAIGQIVLRWPAALSVFEVPGFNEEDQGVEDDCFEGAWADDDEEW
jgi:hypothetical protein